MTRDLDGRILDLGGAEAHRSLWADADVTLLDGVSDPMLLTLVDRGARFDAIVSVMQLVAVADVSSTLSRLRRLLAPDGTLRFLEPGRLGGFAGRAQRLAAPMVTLSTGLRVDRDVPHLLRRSGLSITSLQRHRTGTTQWWHRQLVEGTAHHALLK